MKIDAVGVTSSNLKRSKDFYELLGFSFPEIKEGDKHIEAGEGKGVRLMIDHKSVSKEIIGEEPRPGNHSSFAVLCDSPEEVNEVAEKVREAGFVIAKEPWDAFWGQRYVVVADPDGYTVDLFASLK